MVSSKHIQRSVLALAVPASLEAVFQMGLGFADQVVIGHLGEVPMAAVGAINSLMFVVTIVLGGLATGTAIIVARNQGRGDRDGTTRVIGSGLQIVVMVTAPLAAAGILWPEPLLLLLGVEPAVAEAGREYCRIIAFTLPLSLAGSVLVAALRSMSDARTPMLITLAMVGVNTVLNLVLVFGLGPVPALGVVGSAYATLASQVLRVAALSWRLARKHRAAPDLGHLLVRHQPTSSMLIRLSSPIAMTQVLWATGNLAYTIMGIHLGISAMVATQVVNATEGIFIVLSSGLPSAALTLTGSSFGAGGVAQVKQQARQVIRIGMISAAMFGGALALSSLWIHKAYPELNPAALELAVTGIVLNALFQPAKVANMVLGNGLLPAGGDTRFILLADAVSVYAIGLPLALLLGFLLQLGLVGVFIARLAEEVVKLGLFIWRYRGDRWHHSLGMAAPPGEGPAARENAAAVLEVLP